MAPSILDTPTPTIRHRYQVRAPGPCTNPPEAAEAEEGEEESGASIVGEDGIAPNGALRCS